MVIYIRFYLELPAKLKNVPEFSLGFDTDTESKFGYDDIFLLECELTWARKEEQWHRGFVQQKRAKMNKGIYFTNFRKRTHLWESKKLAIETLVEQFKLAALNIYDFEKKEKNNKCCIFGTFSLSGIWGLAENRTLLIWKVF